MSYDKGIDLKIKLQNSPTISNIMFDETPPPVDGVNPPADGVIPPVDSTTKPEEKKTFTQEEVNAMVANEKRASQKQTQTAIDELNALKQKATLTNEEKADLQSRIETLQNQLLTKEELAVQEKKKLETRYQEDNTLLSKDRDHWKTQYTTSTITNSITNAAVENKAISPEQINALISPSTQLVEELDESGNKTGNYITQVKFNDIDAEGKTKTLTLSVDDAVKRMTELPKYQNLFQHKGYNGPGMDNINGRDGTVDIKRLAQDPAAYRKAIAEGAITNR